MRDGDGWWPKVSPVEPAQNLQTGYAWVVRPVEWSCSPIKWALRFTILIITTPVRDLWDQRICFDVVLFNHIFSTYSLYSFNDPHLQSGWEDVGVFLKAWNLYPLESSVQWSLALGFLAFPEIEECQFWGETMPPCPRKFHPGWWLHKCLLFHPTLDCPTTKRWSAHCLVSSLQNSVQPIPT